VSTAVVVVELESVTLPLLPERVTYTLKDGDQKEKFTIDNTTGELKYKEKQTQIETHKVTIIATDV
jgi:hypothetical protein